MALACGASAVWVGTRFVATVEAGAPPRHKQGIVNAGFHDTIRTIIYTGRPLRVLRDAYNTNWEENRRDEIKKLTSQGIVPVIWDHEKRAREGKEASGEGNENFEEEGRALLMGQVAGAINNVLPAAEVMDEMVSTAVSIIKSLQGNLSKL